MNQTCLNVQTTAVTIFKYMFLTALSAMFIYPLYYLVVTSLKTRQEWLGNQFGFPNAPTLQNYFQAFEQGNLPLWFANTFLILLGAVLVSCLVAALAAYGFTRFAFCGRSTLLNLIIALMVVPPAVLIVPLFTVIIRLHLFNTLSSLIIIYTGLLIPFSIYLLISFFRSLPKELFDAASIDGCSDFGMLWRIVLPLSSPAFVTLIVVNSLYVWNELLLALIFLQSEKVKTLMPGLLSFKERYFNNETLVMTAALLAALPMILLYLYGQRWFMQGLLAGAIKE